MNKNINDLFDRWISSYSFDIFCKDGIVNPEIYFGDTIAHKVLFILKDVHIPKKTKQEIKESKRDVDMRKEVFQDGEGKTWNPIALWAKALSEKNIVPYEETKQGLELRKECLPRVSFMNLKKEAGDASVSYTCIMEYAKEQKEEILAEIKLCSPDIVIACSKTVFTALCEEVFSCQPEKHQIELHSKMKSYGKYINIQSFLQKDSPVYVVEYRHPLDYGRGSLKSHEHYENMLKIRKFAFNE